MLANTIQKAMTVKELSILVLMPLMEIFLVTSVKYFSETKLLALLGSSTVDQEKANLIQESVRMQMEN